MKKSLFIFLTALLAVSLLVGSAAAWGGSGTSSSPYQISSNADLQTWNNNAAAYNTNYFAITADFTPATTISKFAGNLNGNNHILSNLTAPLFNNLGGSVSNLTFVDCLVMGEGVLANTSSASVTNVTAQNCFVSGNATGCLVGTSSGSFTDCTVNYATVKGVQYAGGIAGNGNSAVTRCQVLNSDILATTTYGVCSDTDHLIKKYTIVWDESDSTSKNIRWADDAAGLTEAQRNELIKDHSHFAVVKWDGSKPVVNYYLYRDNLNYRATDETCKTSSGVASNLTGADGDVMLLYDQVWWTTAKSNNDLYITFTWNDPQEDEWVSPHTYGDSLSATSLATYVGLGVFEGYGINSQLRSVNTSSYPTTSARHDEFYNGAVYNRNWQYNLQLPMTYAWYIIQLYFVKGNRDVQAAYGNGIVGGSKSAVNLNWSATNAWNNGTTANRTTGVTALGIQNAWGNICENMGEMRHDSKTMKFTVLGGKDHYNIRYGTASTWKSVTLLTPQYPSLGNIIAISGTPEYPFIPSRVSETDYGLNYADAYASTDQENRSVLVGGAYNYASQSGVMFFYTANSTTATGGDIGARLHVLII